MASDDPDLTVISGQGRQDSPQAQAGEKGSEAEPALEPAPATATMQAALIKERYRIVRELGRGGFGVVYLAHDEQLHSRPVVIKVLLEHAAAGDEWFSRKFREETEALARLDHPGIVNVLDAGQMPDGKPFLAMQFVDGVTLRSAMRALARTGQRMELGRAARIVEKVAQALTAAHERGVVHRDLKPENIMLYTPSGSEEAVKIIDFGIATVREEQAEGAAEQTRVAGSMSYMAPEQLVGRPTASSDIFALGVLAFELVSGTRPFQAATTAAMYIAEQAGLKKNAAELRPDLPAGAQATLHKVLAFAPAERYRTATEFGDEFARAIRSGDTSARLSTSPAAAPAAIEPVSIQPADTVSHIGRRVGIATLLVAIAGAAGVFYYRGLEPERSFSYSITVQRFRDGQPLGPSFTLPGEMIFEFGYQIRFNIASPQTGYLYILNEGPALGSQQLSFNILYPAQGQSAALGAGDSRQIPGRGWIVFDQQEGVEKLWMVWAERPVPELEAAKQFAQSQDQGVVQDAERATAVQRLLSSASASATVIERDEAGRRTIVRGRSKLLVKLTRLEHH